MRVHNQPVATAAGRTGLEVVAGVPAGKLNIRSEQAMMAAAASLTGAVLATAFRLFTAVHIATAMPKNCH